LKQLQSVNPANGRNQNLACVQALSPPVLIARPRKKGNHTALPPQANIQKLF
jgi:hypothetical protein